MEFVTVGVYNTLIMTFKQQIIPKVSSARKAKYSEILPMSERGYVQKTNAYRKGNHWVMEASISV